MSAKKSSKNLLTREEGAEVPFLQRSEGSRNNLRDVKSTSETASL